MQKSYKSVQSTNLPTTNKFTISQLKHLLPFHDPEDIIQNLFGVLDQFIKQKYLKNIIMHADCNLSSSPYLQHQKNSCIKSNTHYDDVEVIEHQIITSPGQSEEVLRESLDLSRLIINYICTKDEQNITKMKQQAKKSKNYLIQSEVQTFSPDFVDRNQNRQLRNLDNYQQSQYSYCCYNFMRNNDTILIMLGFVYGKQDIYAAMLANIRYWNMNRLKANDKGKDDQEEKMDKKTSDTGEKMKIYAIDRADKIIQHLFIAGRSFLRSVSDDYNSNKVNLQNCIRQLKQKGQSQEPLEYYKSYNLFTNTDHTIKLIQYKITYGHHQLEAKQIWQIYSSITMLLLKQAPVNRSCSYSIVLDDSCNKEKKKEGTVGSNQFKLGLALYYREGDVKYVSKQGLYEGCRQIQGLLQSVYSLSNRKQKGDNSLKKSLTLLQKYQNPDNLNSSRIQSSYNNNKLNQSMISNNSSSTYNARKINMKRIAKLQNQIYEIIKLLDTNIPILSTQDMQDNIKRHTAYLKKLHQNTNGYQESISTQEYLMFESIKGVCEELTPEDINLLIKYNQNSMAAILHVYMQPSNYDKNITLGKIIGLQNLQQLYTKTINTGLCEHRYSIIPFFLKKLIQSYYQSYREAGLWQNFELNSISIPELIQLLQTKRYDSSEYKQLLRVTLPQILGNFCRSQPQNYSELDTGLNQKLKIISPLLYLYTEHLLRNKNHHHQFVYSFIGQLVYQVCFFYHEIKTYGLSNAAYIQNTYEIVVDKEIAVKTNKLTLKDKKIMELVRQGGFKGFGYQIRNVLYPCIEEYKSFRYGEELVYQCFQILYALETMKFFKLMANNHINQQIIRVGKFYRRHNFFNAQLKSNKPLKCFILVNQIKDKDKQGEHIFADNKSEEQEQYMSISRRILTSESGIFQQMFRVNPKIKIAGIQLDQAMKNLTQSRKIHKSEHLLKRGTISDKYAIQSLITPQLTYNYQYIKLAQSLKDKYINYYQLDELQKQYFRNCAASIIEKKSSIYDYVVLSNKIKVLKH